MSVQQSSVAKITRPKASGALSRERLFRLLDGRRNEPITWIEGPAGSGKTTLVASYLDTRRLPCLWYQVDEGDTDFATFFYYMGVAARAVAPKKNKPLPLLTPEYLGGLPVFTRRYFEELYGRLKTPFVVVLDNYQEVQDKSTFHDIVSCGLSALPDGINVMILSRSEPPPAFARLRAAHKVSFLSYGDIRFTFDESLQFALRHSVLDRESIKALHEKTEGWAAGMVLMLESAKIEGIDYRETGTQSYSVIFDYFAGEIFSKAAKEVQEFLLKTSVLPKMIPRTAERLTGMHNAGRLLSDLNKNNYFTDRHSHHHPVYQYHPLFREFLLAKAGDVFSRDELSALRSTAAGLLGESGDVEDAAVLLGDAEDWAGLEQLILGSAVLLAVQGRSGTLQEWIERIPGERLNASPWLLYWLGICRMPFTPGESGRLFEQAFHLFKEQKDSTGIFLSWSGAVDTLLFDWNDSMPLDYWIEQFSSHMQSGPSFSSPEVELRVSLSMTIALMIRQPWRSDLPQWLERALSLARQAPDINLRIRTLSSAVNYYAWVGDFSKATSALEEIRGSASLPDVSPLTTITWLWLETAFSITSGASVDSALSQISRVLELAETTGVHVWDHMLFAMGVYVSLIQNDFATASHFLRKKESVLRDRQGNGYSHYLYLSSWYYYLKGDMSRAAADAVEALRLAEETGYIFPIIQARLAAAQLFYEQGRDQEANALTAKAYELANRAKSVQLRYACLLFKAQFAFDGGRDAEGLGFLEAALRLGRENRYFYMTWWFPTKVLSRLCVHALEAGIETGHVRNLIRTCKLEPPEEEAVHRLEYWPWPLKIYTLGQFEIVKDDKPLFFSGKVQKKPLAMLKAIIAFGGKEISEEKLTDLLWPDADGDTAHVAFTTTLHRLRKLIGNERVIQLQGHAVSLDRKYCWVDARAFEHLLEKSTRQPSDAGAPTDTARDLIDKAISLYKGHFLPGDLNKNWTLSLRERLRGSFLAGIRAAAHSYSKEGEWEKAAEYYRKGIDIVDVAEDLYQGLMLCYHRLGWRSDALSVYERCKAVLEAVLGVMPLPQTDALRDDILKS